MVKPIKVEVDPGTTGEAVMVAANKLEPWMVLVAILLIVLIVRSPKILEVVGNYRNQRRSINLKHEQAMSKLNNAQKSATSKARSRTPKS